MRRNWPFLIGSQQCLVAGVSLFIAIDLLILTGNISGWGEWYSADLHLRRQTDAMLSGRFALSDSVTSLTWDEAWVEGCVQQVWGLGVPLWRLPFEAFARALGYPMFPDRIAYFTASAVVFYLLITEFGRSCGGESTGRMRAMYLAPFLLILFPPYVTLFRTRFYVYEEIQAYSYLVSLCFLTLSLSIWRRPAITKFVALALLTLFAILVRPTLLAYAVATYLATLPKVYRIGEATRLVLASIPLLGLGGALIAYSNNERFGAWHEFGHSLNLNSISRMRYASRFADPYANEPLAAAATELFGSLFCVGNSFNGDDWYASGVVPGQSETPRWREFYFRTFDLSHFVFLTLALCGLMYCVGKRSWTDESFSSTVPLILSAWALVAVVVLCIFYLRFPFVASRYLLDFAPSLAAAATACCLGVSQYVSRFQKYGAPLSATVGILFVSLWIWQVVESRTLVQKSRRFPPPVAAGYANVVEELNKSTTDIEFNVPGVYRVGMKVDESLPFNADGWESLSGEAALSVVFYVQDLERLELELEGKEQEVAACRSAIRARVGLEELLIDSTVATNDGIKITFHPPRQAALRQGIEVVFLGLGSLSEFDSDVSPVRLVQLSNRKLASSEFEPPMAP